MEKMVNNKNISWWFKFLLFPILLNSCQILVAQNINFTASAPKAVENGSQFKIVYSINEDASDLNLPDLNDFEILGGPQTSQSSQYSIVNGKTTHTINNSYTFYFRAVKEGTFTIPPATIKVKKKTYKSNPLTIEVVKAAGNKNPQQGQQSQGTQQQNQQTNGGNEDYFLRIYTNKREAYIGEQIVAYVKIYSKYHIEDLKNYTPPSYNGFFQQAIDLDLVRKVEKYNGNNYQTVLIQSVILFPQQSGVISIDPAEITLYLYQKTNSFFGFGQYIPKNLKSNGLKVKIKPLPSNKPSDFNGAVGNFSLTGTVNKTTAKTNDAITIKITLKGKGNIKLIEAPKLRFPPDFESYEPKISSNISNSIAGQSGTKTFEYLAIPRYAGDYTIDPVSFSYFNPETGTFKNLKTSKFNLSILKGNDTITGPIVVGVSKEDIKFLGSDIRFIKTKTNLILKNNYFFGSFLFYMVFPVLLLLMLLIIIIKRKQIQKNKNIWLVKNKKANKMAKKRLRLSYAHYKNGKGEAFYEEMVKALWGYISDKLSISIADLSKDKANDLLSKHQIDKKLTNTLLQIIDECEFARYAPSSETIAMKELYNKAAKTISEIEQKIR